MHAGGFRTYALAGIKIQVSRKFAFNTKAILCTELAFLPGESQGWGSLVGCRLWGCTESDTTEAT